MKVVFKVLLSTLLSLSIVNCAMFGGGEDDGYESNSTTEDSSSTTAEASNDDIREKYVAPELNREEKDSPVIDNDSYDDHANVDSDTAFGEAIDQPAQYAEDSQRSTSTSSFKQGMYTFSEDCQMRDDADQNGAPSGMIRSGKKLWVEPYDSSWHRVYKKSGAVFIRKTCL